MPVTIQKSQKEIRFIIWGAVCERISHWEFALDEMVFNEQLTTGSFHGQFSIADDDILQMMKIAKTKGEIIPYYGVGGSRGSCVYRLQCSENMIVIGIENTTVKESFKFEDKLSQGEVTQPYLIFSIDGKELKKLRSWAHWHETFATTPGYIYEFGQVGLGRLGYTIKVEDTQSGNGIDITDYADW